MQAVTLENSREELLAASVADGYVKNHFFDPPSQAGLQQPRAFLVTMPANSTIRPHFHPVDQFQLFFGSVGATHKGRPIENVLVHYADAYTTYGPYATSTSGLQFFTLRAAADELTGWMPQYRELKIRRSGRNIHVPLPASLTTAAPNVGEQIVENLISGHDDHLLVSLYRAGANAPSPEQDLIKGAGKYYIVLGGSLRFGKATYGRKSVLWASRGEPPLSLTPADDSGYTVLAMQFPTPR